ncbi:hypothetical protein CMUS01_13070 [Colletotrichum musicola]|uniref:Uncharacterized protein n=1 Tax=Colletotrichum musicola TaxID=2175873 RepID=A0A8H6MX73_9PEZI|nr:hypothetical protein CMUS01_13070 [Colletotrichum musicola]
MRACGSEALRAIAYSSCWTRMWTPQEFASPIVFFLCREGAASTDRKQYPAVQHREPGNPGGLAKITRFEKFILHWQMHNNLTFAGSEDGRDFLMGSLMQTEHFMRLEILRD